MGGITPTACYWLLFPTDEEWYAHCKITFVAGAGNYYVFLNAFAILLELVILYLPCRPVWRLHLAKRQRIAIMIIILAGVMYEVTYP